MTDIKGLMQCTTVLLKPALRRKLLPDVIQKVPLPILAFNCIAVCLCLLPSSFASYSVSIAATISCAHDTTTTRSMCRSSGHASYRAAPLKTTSGALSQKKSQSVGRLPCHLLGCISTRHLVKARRHFLNQDVLYI